MQTSWEYRYANRTKGMGSSIIRELLKLTEQPDIISFGGGLPATEVFPLKEFQAIAGDDRPAYCPIFSPGHA